MAEAELDLEELDLEELEYVPMELKISDAYMHARILKAGYEGIVEDIHRGRISKRLFYRIRYSDGDLEDFELQDVIDYQRPVLVLTCCAGAYVEGRIKITCSSMSGTVLANVTVRDILSVRALRNSVARIIDEEESRLRLVSVDGNLLSDSLLCSALA